MSSTILLSDNGASSGSAGLKQTAGNDGVLILQTTTSGGTATNAVYIDNSQNVGINMTPSAWGSSAGDVLQMTGFAMWGSAGISHLSTNTYFDGTNYKYIDTGAVMDYYQYAGGHVLRAADSGTAGASVTTFANLIAVTKGQSLALQGASSQTGTGITFPATQSASTDANTLDDYEEGTWTTTTGTLTNCSSPTLQQARYTKVGRLVTIDGYFDITITSANTLTYLSFTIPFPLISTTAGGCGAAITNNEFAPGGVYRASGATDTVYMLFKASIGFGSGANKFFFTYTYQTT